MTHAATIIAIERARRARESRALAAGLVPINTMDAALKWGGEWESHAHRLERQIWSMQIALMLAEAQWKSSDTLLSIAQEELERMKALTNCATQQGESNEPG